MKIRNGFVSNSSSSSFTCDVCGITESGMDASARDFDMERCINGHTFCNSHNSESETMTPKQYRDEIRKQIESCTWMDKKQIQSDIDEMEKITDDEIEDHYNDNYSDVGVPGCQCPICSMKALNAEDGFVWLKRVYGVTDTSILNEMKKSFKTYIEFKNHIFPKSK